MHKVWFLICLFKLLSITLSLVMTSKIFSSSVKVRYSDTPGVVLAEEQPCITQINIWIIRLRCISAPKSWSHVKNTLVLTILTFRHIHRLHLMYAGVAWALVSSGTQVQLQVILDPDYLPDYNHWKKYMRHTLVSLWNGAIRKNFYFHFSAVFC